MLSMLRSLLSPSTDEPRPRYSAIRSEDDEEALRQPVSRSPSARGRDVYLCFWALGAGILLAWNALMCTFPLLRALFPPESSTSANLASYLGTVFCFGNLFFLGIAQRKVGNTAPTARLRWSLQLMFATTAFLAFPLIPLVFPALSASGSSLLFPLLLALTIVLSVSCSYLQSAVFALAALWGSDELLAVMSGQGGIAVLVSAAQLFLAFIDSSRASIPENEPKSTLAAVGLWALGSLGVLGCLVAIKHLAQHPDYAVVLAPLAHRAEDGLTSGTKNTEVTKRVFKNNIRLESAVAFVFVVTLAIFPPITLTITSTQTPAPKLLQPAMFIATHFLIFNVGDYLGRTYIPSVPGAMKLQVKHIVILSLARVAFFPLFLMCNTPARAKGHLSAFPDVVYFLILLAFGLSNGAISCLCMIFASSPDLNPAISEDEKDIAGTLAAFSLVGGLAIGSTCSFAVNYWINGNPFGG